MNILTFAGDLSRSTARVVALGVTALAVAMIMPLLSPTGATSPAKAVDSSPVNFPVGVSMGNRLFTMTTEQRAVALDQVKNMGATWIRVDMDWGSLQPGYRTWNLQPMDNLVKQAKARDLKVLGIITYTPEWARQDSCAKTFSCPPRSNFAYARFARTLAQRYLGYVHAFEIWNEPNFTLFWPETNADQYGRMFSFASREIRRVNPNVEILVGALAALETGHNALDASTFLRRACIRNRCAEATAVSYHPYTFPRMATDEGTPSTTWQRMLPSYGASNSMYQAARAVGLGGKPFWVTEYGAPTNGDQSNVDHVSEYRQAQIAVSALSAVRQDRQTVGGLFYYTLNDLQTYGNNEDAFGMVRTDGSLKPAYTSLQRALR